MNGLALFAGVGGLELGIELAIPGCRTVCFVDRDAYAASALVARMADAALAPAPIWDDVTTFDGEPWRGIVDLVSAGFPCQPFSAAGKKRGQDDERWLWDDIVRILREVQPRWIVLENVPGLVRLGLGPVLRDLAVLGYDAEWDLFKASDVGAPHRRERFFLLAKRRDGSDMADPTGNVSLGIYRQRDAGGMGGSQGQEEGRESEVGGLATKPECRGEAAGEMADSDHYGCGGCEERDEREARGVATPRGNHPHGCGLAFPPGPADLDLWARVLTEAPEVEPSICGMADGMAERMVYRQDRLRACGNGVVPLQAAYAVVSLAHRAGWLEELLAVTVP